MADVEDGAEVFKGNGFEEIEQGLAAGLVKPLGGLVEEEQARHLDQGAGEQHQPLLAVAEALEGNAGAVRKFQPPQPTMGQGLLLGRGAGIETDGVKQPGDDDGQCTAGNTMVAVQVGADDAHVALQVPDRLATAAPPAEHGQVIDVTEGMVAGDKLQQG